VRMLRGDRYDHFEKSSRTLLPENGTLAVPVRTGSAYITE
jgi:hypothetical protein